MLKFKSLLDKFNKLKNIKNFEKNNDWNDLADF